LRGYVKAGEERIARAAKNKVSERIMHAGLRAVAAALRRVSR
jgi:hypothetical protein